MDAYVHTHFMNFLHGIEGDKKSRKEFLDNPLFSIVDMLKLAHVNIDVDFSPPNFNLTLADRLLIEMLKSDGAVKEVDVLISNYENKNLNLEEFRKKTAALLTKDLPPDIKQSLEQKWGGSVPPDVPAGAPHAVVIANIAAAVDVVVVTTLAAVFNSEYVFSGNNRNTNSEIQRIATVISMGV